ncbi:MAG TPA: zf-HC2 domain-containing protein [Gemmatimonadaceae bacterium]
MQHLDEGTIHAWLDGALSTEEAARVEAHVAMCDECSALVAEARGLIAGASRIVSSLDIVRGDVIPKSKPAPRALWNRLHLSPSRAALAATLLIAVSSLLVIRHAPTNAQKATLAEAASAGASAGASPIAPSAAPAPAATVPPKTADALRSTTAANAASAARAARQEIAGNAKSDTMPRVAQSQPRDSAVVAASVPAAPLPVPPPLAANAQRAAAMKVSANAIETRDSSAKRVAVAAAKNSAGGAAGASATAGAGTPPRTDKFDPRTLKPNDANPATQLPLNASGRRVAAGQTMQLNEVVSTALTRAEPRCYMIVPDASELSRTLPDRFALTLSIPDSARLVRLVTADGRIDGVVQSATWRPDGIAAVRIDFPMSGTRFAPVTFIIRDGSLRAEASSASTTRTISIRPIDCREEH